MKIPYVAYKTLKQIKYHDLLASDFLLMVSGGKDSMVLLDVFWQIKNKSKISFRVIYVHHGNDKNKNHRDKSLSLIKVKCQNIGAEFITNKELPTALKSEEDFRNFRYQEVLKHTNENSIIVSAHHQMDLLETRIMRLIRGCGPEGLLAIKDYSEPYFRPFLGFTVLEIEKYASDYHLDYMEDPTNQDTAYFRNWLRHEWLLQLEKADKGSLNNLANSLDNIANAWQDRRQDFKKWFSGNSLRRDFLLNLDFSHQLQVLALYLQENGHYSFQRSQLEEILKLLDNRQKSYKFQLLNIQWSLSQDEILIESLA